MRSGLLSSLALTGLLALAAAAPAMGAEPFGLESFDVAFSGAGGDAQLQAGSHPYAMDTTLGVNSEEVGEELFPVEAVKDLEVTQVPGFAGDPTAVPPCSTLDFLSLPPGKNDLPECADSSAVGVSHVTVGSGEAQGTFNVPLYNLAPSPGHVARLGFVVQSVPVTVDVGVSQTPPLQRPRPDPEHLPGPGILRRRPHPLGGARLPGARQRTRRLPLDLLPAGGRMPGGDRRSSLPDPAARLHRTAADEL